MSEPTTSFHQSSTFNTTHISLHSLSTSKAFGLYSFIIWAQKESIRIAEIFLLEADLLTTNQFNEAQILVIIYALTIKALSITKANITNLELFLSSISYNINYITKIIFLVSCCVNIVSNTITTTNS
jgi:hypothetical protein